LDPFQSGFRTGHSTETALLKINNDIMMSLDKNRGTLLLLLDLSAAFDTLHHSLLLQILKTEFGLDGVVLEWFSSYLSQRTFAVFTKTHESTSHPITSGVPQGSVLGPVLFTLYMTPLTKIFNKWNVLYHLYADDTQVYLEYDPSLESDLCVKANTLSSCLAEVGSWMSSHSLVLNQSKTQLLIVRLPHLDYPPSDFAIKIGDVLIHPSEKVFNLGVNFNKDMSMHDQISHICSAAFYNLRMIARNKAYLPSDVMKTLVQALVFSRIDYCNSLLINLPKYLMNRLQHIQNAAAKCIFSLRPIIPTSPFLQ
jgi:hypothetical protein